MSYGLDSIYNFAVSIARSSQGASGGGLLGYVVDQIEVKNVTINSTTTAVKLDLSGLNVKKYLFGDVLASGGLPWAIAAGVLFLVLVLLLGIILCGLQFKRRKSTKAAHLCKTLSRRMGLHLKRSGKSTTSTVKSIVTPRLVVVTLLLLLLALSVLTLLMLLVNLHTALSTSSSATAPSVLPLLNSAITRIRAFLDTFGDAALRDTAPVVDEMIQATIEMQRQSSKEFNAIVQEAVGGKESMELGDRMTAFLYTVVTNTTYLNGGASNDALNSANKISTSLPTFVQHLNSLTPHPAYLVEAKAFFENLHYIEPTSMDFFTFSFAQSAQFMLVVQEGRTPERILADGQFGRKKMAEQMAALEAKSARLMDIPGTVGNTTRANYILMGQQMQNHSRMLGEIQVKLHEVGSKVLVKVRVALFLVLVAALLCLLYILGLAVVAFAMPNFSSDFHSRLHGQQTRLQYATYTAFFLLCLVVLVMLFTFISGAILETQLCRFLRTSAYPKGDNPVDHKINTFLTTNWPMIRKMAQEGQKEKGPVPRPQNILHGLATKCKINAPILEALGAIDSIDPADLNKPEVSNRFLRIGRQLMEEAMMETNPRAMLANGTEASLNQAGSLKAFNQDYEYFKRYVSSYAFLEDSSSKTNVTEAQVIEHLERLLNKLRPEDITLREDAQRLLQDVQSVDHTRQRVLTNLGHLSRLEDIMPVVQRLQVVVPRLIDTMSNKTELLRMANALFDKHVVALTPQKSLEMMTKFAPKIMSRIGYCRPVYEAFEMGTSAMCHSVDYPLNGTWLLYGIAWLLSLAMLLLLVLIFAGEDEVEMDVKSGIEMRASPGDSDEPLETDSLNPKKTEAHLEENIHPVA